MYPMAYIPAIAPTNVMIAIMKADNASARRKPRETIVPAGWPEPAQIAAATKPPATKAATLATPWIASISLRFRIRLIAPEASAGIESSKTSIIAGSTPKRTQVLHVDGFEIFFYLVYEDFHDQNSDKYIEKHTHLDDERNAVGCKQGNHEDAVLEHEKP